MISVDLLMPTLPGRETFRQRAIESLMAQVYPDGWIITVHQDIDDGTLGAKINRLMEKTSAPYAVLTDDDDFHGPTRIQRQVVPLINGFDYSGTSQIYYHDTITDEGWLYKGIAKMWLGGLAFTRALWEKKRFQDITIGTDTRWQAAVQAEHKAKYFDVCDPALFIASIHSGNSSPKKKESRMNSHWSLAALPPFPKV